MKGKINKHKREITFVIVATIVIIFFFSGFSMGKQISKTSINTKVEIAKPIVKIDNNPAIDIKTTNDKGAYDFIVKNYDESGMITAVDMEYSIEVLSKINENISLKIYKENQEIELKENKTENFLLTNKEKQEHHYRMEIMCNQNEENTIQEIIQDIQIKVHSEQKKA